MKLVTKTKKRLGRGYGSGKGGHTAGRGQKGQKTRAHINVLFEGAKAKKSFIKRLPFRRGKGKFSAKAQPVIVQLAALNLLPAGKVNIDTLAKQGIVKLSEAKLVGVKILGSAELTKKYVVSVAISKSAAKVVEKAGGSVEAPQAK